MLETYFVAPKTLRRLRSGPAGFYIDGFAEYLKTERYTYATAVRYLRAANHLGHFVVSQSKKLEEITPETLNAFQRHLPSCRCPLSNGGHIEHHILYGTRRFVAYLQTIGVLTNPSRQGEQEPEAPLLASFRYWLRRHRGVAETTLKLYCWGVNKFLQALGDDPSQYDVQRIRAFFLDYANQCGTSTAQKLSTSLRVFLRYLSVQGQCPAGLDQAIPALAGWRLATLPRCLNGDEVEQLLAACQGDNLRARRAKAIILLLVRLGLRAGDVANLRLSDVDWEDSSLRVMGKGGYEVRLPLSQDVGDALLRYLEGRPQVGSDRVFLRVKAPCRPFRSGDAVSSVVSQTMKRAGINPPSKRAHILRHTAATEMLRQGASLFDIGQVLRHRSMDTTAYYAKVDVTLLSQVAQPWPEVLQ
jgi:site-specific recombinase XerD